MKMTISIVMATYNGEKYLKDQLDSLARQTVAPHELIVSDDDSSDGTDAIVQEFARSAPFPVRVFKNSRRLGFQENFLQAASLATGEWVAFCDQDDVWHADKLRLCSSFTVDPAVTLIVHQARLIDANGEFIRRHDQTISETCVRAPLHYNPWRIFAGFSMVFRRSVLDVIPSGMRFRDRRKLGVAHDRWVFFLAHTLGRTVEVAEPLVSYRQHASNVSGVKRGSIEFGPARAIREILHHFAVETGGMLSLTGMIPGWAEETFPSFDRRKAEEFYASEAAHFQGREAIYAATRAQALSVCLGMLWSGRYRNVHNDRLRWRSVLKDLFYIVAR